MKLGNAHIQGRLLDRRAHVLDMAAGPVECAAWRVVLAVIAESENWVIRGTTTPPSRWTKRAEVGTRKGAGAWVAPGPRATLTLCSGVALPIWADRDVQDEPLVAEISGEELHTAPGSKNPRPRAATPLGRGHSRFLCDNARRHHVLSGGTRLGP